MVGNALILESGDSLADFQRLLEAQRSAWITRQEVRSIMFEESDQENCELCDALVRMATVVTWDSEGLSLCTACEAALHVIIL